MRSLEPARLRLAVILHGAAVNPGDVIVQDRIQLCERELAASGKYIQPAIHPEPIGAAIAEELEEGLEKDPSAAKIRIPGSVWNPKQRLARARGRDATTIVDPRPNDFHDARFDATGGTIHIDVSINYLVITLLLAFGILAALILRRLCQSEKKVKI
jgi:hypothetical protein